MRILGVPGAFLLMTAFAVGCTDQPIPTESSPAELASSLEVTEQAGNTLLGSWRLVSAVEGDAELLSGISLIQTLRSDLTFSWNFSNAVESTYCGSAQTSCEWSGTYTSNSTRITLTETVGPEPGPDSFVYALVCGRLLMGDASGDGHMLIFKRTRP